MNAENNEYIYIYMLSTQKIMIKRDLFTQFMKL